MKIYKILPNRYFGGSIEVPDGTKGIPIGHTRTPTPDIPDGYFAVWIGNGWSLTSTPPPEKTSASANHEIKTLIVEETQKRLDDFAKTRLYDGIMSLCTYANSSIPRFAAEGIRGVELRDQTWAALYAILEEVESGARPIPTSFQDIESELPSLTWTN